jgi:2-polyprenyl-6-methoxyphenol hydroxylase-like FAD-dependent oxidoreductase
MGRRGEPEGAGVRYAALTMRLDGPVLIIGAGIGGLTLANALAQRGFAYRLFERARSLEPVGAGILVQTSALLALRTLRLDAAVAEQGQDVRLGFLKTDRGRTLQRTSMSFLQDALGVSTVAIHRARLQQVLLGAADALPIALGAELAGYELDEGGVTALFADGRRERGALLVGADGLHSAVRRASLGDSPLRYAGYTSWRGVADLAGAMPAHEVTEMWGVGARFGFADISRGETYWFAVLNAREGERESNSLDLVRRHFGAWAEPVPKLLANTRPDRVFRTDIHDRPPVASWSRERVTLLGDAAHPTTPNLGQGGSMAIEDAVVLAHALERASSLPEALADYEQRRVARTSRVVEASFRFGRLAHVDNRFAIAVRNALFRLMPEGIVQKELRRGANFSL